MSPDLNNYLIRVVHRFQMCQLLQGQLGNNPRETTEEIEKLENNFNKSLVDDLTNIN